MQAQLEQDAYFKPYHTLADKYRAYWADPAHMDVLISCPSLGLSALSQAEKQIAKTHLAILFKGYNQLREPAGVKKTYFARLSNQNGLMPLLILQPKPLGITPMRLP